MIKAVIFGAGSKTNLIIKELEEKYAIQVILDNDKSLWGQTVRKPGKV